MAKKEKNIFQKVGQAGMIYAGLTFVVYKLFASVEMSAYVKNFAFSLFSAFYWVAHVGEHIFKLLSSTLLKKKPAKAEKKEEKKEEKDNDDEKEKDNKEEESKSSTKSLMRKIFIKS